MKTINKHAFVLAVTLGLLVLALAVIFFLGRSVLNTPTDVQLTRGLLTQAGWMLAGRIASGLLFVGMAVWMGALAMRCKREGTFFPQRILILTLANGVCLWALFGLAGLKHQILMSEATDQSRALLRQAATDLESFKMAHGVYPRNLEQLASDPAYEASPSTVRLEDPFAQATILLGYAAFDDHWILRSLGPDRREQINPVQVDFNALESSMLVELTYDPTNGLLSLGDVWREKQ